MSVDFDAISFVEKKFGITLRHKCGEEWCGPCPFCGGVDRFLTFEKGNYMCRPGDGHCGRKGWLDEFVDDKTWSKLTDHEKRIITLERNQATLERKQDEIRKRVDALSVMRQSRDHIQYHDQLDAADYQHWSEQGIFKESVDFYKLGICYSCPLAQNHPSWTIPVYDSHWENLLNIRHRLIDVESGDRYRPHMAGLGSQLFNSRFVLTEKELVLVEGEKKSIVVSDLATPAIATSGTAFNMAWLRHFIEVQRLNIAFDPDATEKAWRLGVAIKKKAPHIDVRVCTLPAKPDNLLTFLGGDRSDFMPFIDLARKV